MGYVALASFVALLYAEGALASDSLSRQELRTIEQLVNAKTGCDLCVDADSFVGKMAVLPVDDLSAIRRGQASADAKRDALMRFVSYLQTTSGTIGLDESTAIRAAGYTKTQLTEISLTIALAIFTNTFNHISGTDVDFPPIE